MIRTDTGMAVWIQYRSNSSDEGIDLSGGVLAIMRNFN